VKELKLCILILQKQKPKIMMKFLFTPVVFLAS